MVARWTASVWVAGFAGNAGAIPNLQQQELSCQLALYNTNQWTTITTVYDLGEALWDQKSKI